MKDISALVMEGNEKVRRGIVSLLNEFREIGEVREVSGMDDLENTLRAWQPDVVLVDLDLAGGVGLETAGFIINHYQKVRVIGLSFHQEEKFIPRLIQMGAHGYLLKDFHPEELRDAILAACEKKFYLTEHMFRIIRESVKDFFRMPVMAGQPG
jgi:DNA-binding NarL/FixJ family response regulator